VKFTTRLKPENLDLKSNEKPTEQVRGKQLLNKILAFVERDLFGLHFAADLSEIIEDGLREFRSAIYFGFDLFFIVFTGSRHMPLGAFLFGGSGERDSKPVVMNDVYALDLQGFKSQKNSIQHATNLKMCFRSRSSLAKTRI
jgi:hypothetical protein